MGSVVFYSASAEMLILSLERVLRVKYRDLAL
jgi:hypothetical protein